MNFNRIELLIPILVFAIFLIYLFLRKDKQIVAVVEDNWLMKKKKTLTIRQGVTYLGFLMLVIALLDLRGPVLQVEGSVPDQKTLIIVDSSSSMFVEDVRPSRYRKSLIIARHFVKQAVAHQVSIVLFSDIQKRLVPFTDDVDFLVSRISALENDSLAGGGSNIVQALQESIGYFKTSLGNKKIQGNILILTDSEGHDGLLTEDIPEGINVAVVGVGTLNGGKIPIRDSRGVFKGYQKYKGEEVVSKLNEKWIKELGEKIPSFKYWIANSYALPTEEIVNFFRRNFIDNLAKGNVSVKPVWAHYLLIPGLFLIILGYGSYFLVRFAPLGIVLMLMNTGLKGQEEKIEIPLSKELLSIEKRFKDGELNREEKLYYAQELVKNKKFKMASVIFEELSSNLGAKDLNNYGASLLGEKKVTKALKRLQEAENKVEVDNKELALEVKKNILRALKMKEQDKKKQENKNKKSEDEKKKEKEDKESDKKKGNDKQESKDKKKQKKDGEESKDSKEKKKEEEREEGEDQKKKNKPQKKSVEEQLKDKEKDEKLKRKMKKVPGIIKQIMSDDRRLQKKYLDTSTKKKDNTDLKDW